jgi:UDP-N-acetylglucosamine transferase subunit ALG13
MPVVVSQPSGSEAESVPTPIARPFVFVTVGTDHHPFNRLVQWVDAWAAAHTDIEVVIQHGEATGPVHAEAKAYVTHSELNGFIERADIIVSHGGPATIAEAWRRGLIPIVAPRGHSLGEHVDNHQQAFAAVLADREQAILVKSETDLISALDHAIADPQWLRRASGLGGDIDATIRRFSSVVAAVTGGSGRVARAKQRRQLRRLAK